MVRRTLFLAAFALILSAAGLAAQVLPPHAPLRILIVSDEVNPHGLPPEDLTQPGEISAALAGVSVLELDNGPDALLEIPTDSLETATALLELPAGDPLAYDVLIYFAHRIPNGADGATRQEAFVTAVDAFLSAGGGVISFHHGIFRTGGKESMQALLGAEATGSVIWDTTNGQNVISVAPGHFITSYGVTYPATVSYEDAGFGVPPGLYPVFNQTPDEQYPNYALLSPLGDIQPLFASDYTGGTHVLGYLKRQPSWLGVVFTYQPGEHQPQALEPGNSLQILLNGILFTASFSTGDLFFGDGFESGDLGLWSSSTGAP